MRNVREHRKGNPEKLATYGFSKDSVQVVHGIEQHLLTNSTHITPKIITTKVTWPNEISGVPSKCVNLIET
jgi:hypothetical protein